MNFITQLNRWFTPWRNKIVLMILKGVISSVKDSGNLQVLKMSVLSNEVIENIPRVQEFGFSSNPPVGAEAVVVCIGGDRSNMVCIATDYSKGRPKDMAEGDTVLYNKNGMKLYLKGSEVFCKTENYNFKFERFIDLFLGHAHGYFDTVGTTPTPSVTGTISSTVPPSSPLITAFDFKEVE